MPAGRPSKYKPEYCDQVIEYGKQGMSLAQMAAKFDVARSTIDQWAADNPEFSEALSRAITHMQAELEKLGFDGLKNREFNAAIWKTTMQARFREDYTERREIDQKTKLSADDSIAGLLARVAADGGKVHDE